MTGHSSDCITDSTLEWFKTKRDKSKPFFLMHHYKAPHDMFDHAHRYNDYLEDIEGADAQELRDEFGDRVTNLVLSVSEPGGRPKPSWRERKDAYLTQIRGAAPETKLISAADKLHNVQSLRRELQAQGAVVWTRFTGSVEDTLWFYGAVADALRLEPSRGGELFPHVYRALRRADVMDARIVQRGPDGWRVPS